MSVESDPTDEAAARRAFLKEYSEDLVRGDIRQLEEYQARYPGFEAAVAEEFDCLENEGETNTALPASTLGPSTDEAKDERLAGYRIHRELGRGGQAVVYLARDEELGRDVALKVLSAGFGLREDSAEFRRFRREAESTARLDHPGICTVYATGEADGLAYIAMRYVRGETLARILARCREADAVKALGRGGVAMVALPSVGEDSATTGDPSSATWSGTGVANDINTILLLIERCARALHVAHEQGLVHRDVKPGNIIVQPDGHPVLLDFGIASLESSDHSLTGSGMQIGTPYYMAPEQVRGTAVDRRTDVYALGVLLYESLTLQRPFDASSREALYNQILTAQPVPARRLNPRIAADAQVVLETAMELDPQRRYQTALALAEDLERLRNFQTIAARPLGPLLRARRWSQRHPVRSAVLAVGVVALTVAMLLWYRAENALADWGRLADLRRVQDLVRAADQDLWPLESTGPRAFASWLEEADAVLARRKIHEQRLAALREHALPYGDDERERDRKEGRAGERLRRLEQARAALAAHLQEQALPAHQDPRALKEQQQRLGEQVRAEQADLEERRRWRFADTDRQWQHDVLADLLRRLDGLQALRADVVQRSGRAAELGRRSLSGEARALWRKAITAIAASPLYGNLRIQPQRGLLPLRADPGSGLWEFAHLASGEPPATGEEGHYRLAAETGLVFVLLPGGQFRMGTPAGSLDGVPGIGRLENEAPEHDVALDPFFLSKYEMTQAQWERIAGENPSIYKPGSHNKVMFTPLHPVENIRKATAAEILRRLGLVLPTEAQWEYAARANNSGPWWCGEDPQSLEGNANIADRRFGNPPFEQWLDDGYPCHAPVGSYGANAFGLHDVAGNVWEWCLDGYGLYTTKPRAGDGLRFTWNLDHGIRRGGCWMSRANEARSARRLLADRSFRNGTIGVRPARSLDRTVR